MRPGECPGVSSLREGRGPWAMPAFAGLVRTCRAGEERGKKGGMDAGEPARASGTLEPAAFQELIRRVRAGEEAAARELVQRYESAIRVMVRVRLTDPGLRRLLDSVDICQSVLANFFVRAAHGQFSLERPEQLLRLLAAMARNKLNNHWQAQHAARRDQGRNVPSCEPDSLIDPGPSPSRIVSGRELLSQVRARLTPEERAVAEERAAGADWREIAARRGERPDTIRMRFTRALDRVARELELDS